MQGRAGQREPCAVCVLSRRSLISMRSPAREVVGERDQESAAKRAADGGGVRGDTC